MGEERESIEPDDDAQADVVEGHAIVGDRDVEVDDAVEGHALEDDGA